MKNKCFVGPLVRWSVFSSFFKGSLKIPFFMAMGARGILSLDTSD